ncbi:MAG: hypothetical protein WBQ14_05840 [Gaiellaceae bacterium]
MNAPSLHPLARDYMKRLKKAAAILPRGRRSELIGEIESHLSEALPAGASEAEALNVLERLGEPAEIVAEAASGQAPTRAGLTEWFAITLLLVGGFLFLVGWVVGAVLLWSSTVWTLRDKLIGTLLLPGGLATSGFVFMFAGAGTGSGSGISGEDVDYLALVLFGLLGALLVALPVLTAIYLSRRAKRAMVAT